MFARNLKIVLVGALVSLGSSACWSQCGNCNEDSGAITVLDALAAATIDAGLISPTAYQELYCDVDSSGATDIVDALFVAQRSAGLPVVFSCRMSQFPLGSVGTFGVFGGSAGMTNSGLQTVISGDIGTTAVSTMVTGFHDAGPGCTYTETPLNVGIVNGLIYTAAPPPTPLCSSEGTTVTFQIATQARADALAAYDALAAMPAGSDPGAGSLANLVLAPGVYTSASGSFLIQGGDLTLDPQGDPDAVWVFQMATTLTVGGPGASFPQSIILLPPAQAGNVYWQVGSSATVNAAGGGTMVGTIIAQAGASFSTMGNVVIVTLEGRALSLGAAVTLTDTVINVP